MLPNDLWSACLSRSKLSSLARWMHLANGEMSGWNSVTRHVSNCASLLTVIYFYPSHYLPIMWNESSEIYAQMRVAIASIHPISIHGRYLSSHIPYMRELWCCCCCSDWLAIKSIAIRQQASRDDSAESHKPPFTSPKRTHICDQKYARCGQKWMASSLSHILLCFAGR